MKFQIYLRISEAQPIFRLQSRLKLCKSRTKFQISTSEYSEKVDFFSLLSEAEIQNKFAFSLALN